MCTPNQAELLLRSPHRRSPTPETATTFLAREQGPRVGRCEAQNHTRSAHLLSNLSQSRVQELPPGFPLVGGAPWPLGHTPAAVNLVHGDQSPSRFCGGRIEGHPTNRDAPTRRHKHTAHEEATSVDSVSAWGRDSAVASLEDKRESFSEHTHLHRNGPDADEWQPRNGDHRGMRGWPTTRGIASPSVSMCYQT